MRHPIKIGHPADFQDFRQNFVCVFHDPDIRLQKPKSDVYVPFNNRRVVCNVLLTTHVARIAPDSKGSPQQISGQSEKIRTTHGEKRSAIQRQVCLTTKGCAWVHDERPSRQRAPCTLARPMAAMADPPELCGQPVHGGQALPLSGHSLKRSGTARKQKGTPGPTQIGHGTSGLTFIASCVPSIRLAVNGMMQGSPQTRCGASLQRRLGRLVEQGSPV